MTKYAVVALLLLGLSGCGTQPSNLQFYMLHSPDSDNTKALAADAPMVIFGQIVFPEYLTQRNLSILTGSTTVHFSPKHVWAEPIAAGFAQALEENLRRQGIRGLSKSLNYPITSSTKVINIKVEDFIPTYNGKVILSGQYWFDSNEHLASSLPVDFNYSLTLQQDGFAYSVEKMRELVVLLSQDIASSIN